jgi:hypothetical protein
MRGFAVRKQRRDAVYVLKYRAGGKQRLYTIGLHGPPWTVEAARIEAQRLLGEIAKGTDPALLRDKMKVAPTLDEFAKRYLAEVSDTHKKASTAREDRRMLRLHILPRLGDRKVAAIDNTDVARFHSGMKATPVGANRALALLSHMLSYATEKGERADNTESVPPRQEVCGANARTLLVGGRTRAAWRGDRGGRNGWHSVGARSSQKGEARTEGRKPPRQDRPLCCGGASAPMGSSGRRRSVCKISQGRNHATELAAAARSGARRWDPTVACAPISRARGGLSDPTARDAPPSEPQNGSPGGYR